MAVQHVIRVEFDDERTQLLHVPHTLHKSSKCLEVFNLLVDGQRLRHLLQLHFPDQGFEIWRIDLVPQRLLPGFELPIDQSNQVPHLL